MTNRQTKGSGARWIATLGAAALLVSAAPAAAGQAAKESVGLQGVQAHVDKAGKLRQPSPAEMKALTDAVKALFARSAQGAQGALVTEHADGSVSAKLGPDSMNVWVATIGPDGQLRQTCVEGVNAANALQAAPALEEK